MDRGRTRDRTTRRRWRASSPASTSPTSSPRATPALNPFDPATDPTSEFQPERFAVRLRVRVIAHPVDPADTVNNEAVRQKQVDVYPATESVVRDDLGVPFTEGTDGIAVQDAIHAATGARGRYAGGAGSPSYHDLDGDGTDELLLPTTDGVIHAFTDVATGEELPGWPVTVDRLPSLQRHVGRRRRDPRGQRLHPRRGHRRRPHRGAARDAGRRRPRRRRGPRGGHRRPRGTPARVGAHRPAPAGVPDVGRPNPVPGTQLRGPRTGGRRRRHVRRLRQPAGPGHAGRRRAR